MRSEQEMMNLLLQVAKQDERVRVVAMNGSRTNCNVPKDNFRDYDIVYVVNDLLSFINKPEWVDVFGKRIIMQTPEDMTMFPPELGGRFSYLMLFEDGNRIDLLLVPLQELEIYCAEDSLTVILLDKDHRLTPLPTPSDQDYWIKRPSAAFFTDCCNEFWWLSTYVAKGLWRQEVIYAYDHLNAMRDMLLTMLAWQVGIDTKFSLSVGKNYKYLQSYVSEVTWQKLMETYPVANQHAIWQALSTMIMLFEEVAMQVAKQLEYHYPAEEANGVKQYISKQ